MTRVYLKAGRQHALHNQPRLPEPRCLLREVLREYALWRDDERHLFAPLDGLGGGALIPGRADGSQIMLRHLRPQPFPGRLDSCFAVDGDAGVGRSLVLHADGHPRIAGDILGFDALLVGPHQEMPIPIEVPDGREHWRPVRAYRAEYRDAPAAQKPLDLRLAEAPRHAGCNLAAVVAGVKRSDAETPRCNDEHGLPVLNLEQGVLNFSAMRPTTEATQVAGAIATRAAYVLADVEVWSRTLGEALEGLGLEVFSCTELHELFEVCRDRPASLLVLAQRNNAFAVRACRVIRGLQDTPMMVVMPREGDLIPVLDAGADDAVVARVDPAVFGARVRALMRRARPASRNGGMLAIRELVLDLEKFSVSLNGKTIALTPTEFRLLAVLAQQAGRVVDPRALLSAVHQHDYGERDAQNLVKVHIANLRRKLNDSRTTYPYILCVRGFGYMLERRSAQREDDPLATLIETE